MEKGAESNYILQTCNRLSDEDYGNVISNLLPKIVGETLFQVVLTTWVFRQNQ